MGGHDDRFVSRQWLRNFVIAAWSLWMAAVGGAPPLNVGAGMFVFLGIAACAMGVTGWYLSSQDPSDSTRGSIRRRLALVLVGLALLFSVALAMSHETVTALATTAVGFLLAAALWPITKRWWRYDLGAPSSERPYSSSLFGLALAMGIFGIGFGGLFVVASGVDSFSETSIPTRLLGALFIAEGVAYLIEAWDERRRLGWEKQTSGIRQPS